MTSELLGSMRPAPVLAGGFYDFPEFCIEKIEKARSMIVLARTSIVRELKFLRTNGERNVHPGF